MTNDKLDLSVILPVYNEEESIPLLLEELIPVLDKMGISFEVICIDDGSRDNSFAELKKLRQADDRVRVVRFRRNFGQRIKGILFAQDPLVVLIRVVPRAGIEPALP